MQKWQRFLSDVDDAHAFTFHKNGKVKNIIHMLTVLSSCSQQDFEHHVTDEKNDIVVWIRDILHDGELAGQLQYITDKQSMIAIIEKRVKEVSEYVKHLQNIPLKRDQKLSSVIDNIEKLEKDLEVALGHTSRDAPFKYKAEKIPFPPLGRVHWTELGLGVLVGFLFALLLVRISGVL